MEKLSINPKKAETINVIQKMNSTLKAECVLSSKLRPKMMTPATMIASTTSQKTNATGETFTRRAVSRTGKKLDDCRKTRCRSQARPTSVASVARQKIKAK